METETKFHNRPIGPVAGSLFQNRAILLSVARALEPTEDPGFEFRLLHQYDPLPWHLWMDGRVWELEQGVDFQEPMLKFRARVYRRARIFDQRAQTHITGNKIYIQFPV